MDFVVNLLSLALSLSISPHFSVIEQDRAYFFHRYKNDSSAVATK